MEHIKLKVMLEKLIQHCEMMAARYDHKANRAESKYGRLMDIGNAQAYRDTKNHIINECIREDVQLERLK